MDLTRSVVFRGMELNSVTVTGEIAGYTVDSCEYGDVEIRQFMEPRALADGLDIGGVWLGARRITMTGTVYDDTRGKAFDRIALLDALFWPTAEYLLDPTSFGFGELVFYVPSAGGDITKTILCRSNGLRVAYTRKMFGGNDEDPLAIPWSVTFLAKDPTITGEQGT